MMASMTNEPAEPRHDGDEHEDDVTQTTSTDSTPEDAASTDAAPVEAISPSTEPASGDVPLTEPIVPEPDDEPGSAAELAAEPQEQSGSESVPPPGSGVPPPGGGATSSEPADPTQAADPSQAAGAGAPQMAPTGGYAAQHGLVRPVNGRYIAGVCGALGRATNTDPVLWRVLLPVLMVVGLLGGLIYLLGWLLIPSEGDSASPFEALIGRGHSSLSKGWTLALSILTVLIATGGFAIGNGGRFLVFVAIVGGAVLLVLSRNPRAGWSQQPTTRPPWAQPATQPPWTPPSPTASGAQPAEASSVSPEWTASPVVDDASATAAWNAQPTTEEPAVTMAAQSGYAQSGYQAPFAPHGPYVPTDPYQTAVFPPTDQGDAPPMVAPRPPKPTGPRRAILSSVVLAVGLLGALDVSNLVSVPVPAYFAVALGVLGLGMVIASFFGRVRGPITLGFLLVIGLATSAAISTFHGDYNNTYNIKPASVADLNSDYQENTGRMTLDLSDLNLTGAHTVNVHLNVGLLRVKVPRNVDVTVSSRVQVGATEAFGHQRGGIGNGPLEVTDNGPDGPGGGTLIIDADVNVGKVEVSR
jgi:phage shock protein PspC (stress-responsive transcriptional regulator)